LVKNGPSTWVELRAVIEDMTKIVVGQEITLSNELNKKRPLLRKMVNKKTQGSDGLLAFFCYLFEL